MSFAGIGGVAPQTIQRLSQEIASGRKNPLSNAANTAVAERLLQNVGINQAGVRNANLASSRVQTQFSQLQSVNGIVNDLSELAVRASDSTLTGTQRANLQTEFDALVKQVGSAVSGGSFNGNPTLQGAQQTVSVGESVLEFTDPNGQAIVDVLAGVSISDVSSAQDAISQLEGVQSVVSTQTVETGVNLQSLERAADNARTAAQNEQRAAEELVGVDLAEAIAELIAAQVQQEVEIFALRTLNNIESNTVLNLLPE